MLIARRIESISRDCSKHHVVLVLHWTQLMNSLKLASTKYVYSLRICRKSLASHYLEENSLLFGIIKTETLINQENLITWNELVTLHKFCIYRLPHYLTIQNARLVSNTCFLQLSRTKLIIFTSIPLSHSNAIGWLKALTSASVLEQVRTIVRVLKILLKDSCFKVLNAFASRVYTSRASWTLFFP
jgi:hypothetical protein